MFFYGIEKNSLNDFLGKISCVIFTAGCNFFCPYCHNPQIVLNKDSNNISEKEFFTFIKKRKKLYDGIVISGGEPTLNKELPIICKKIKEMGFLIKLDTNGSNPNMLIKLLNKKRIDYIAMDLKTDLSVSSYRQFTREPNIISLIKKSIQIIIEKAPDYEFRTTCVSPFINKEKIYQICSQIKGAKRYTLQPFNKNASSILDKKFLKPKETLNRKDIMKFVEIASPMVKYCKISNI